LTVLDSGEHVGAGGMERKRRGSDQPFFVSRWRSKEWRERKRASSPDGRVVDVSSDRNGPSSEELDDGVGEGVAHRVCSNERRGEEREKRRR